MTNTQNQQTPALADIMVVGGGMIGTALALGLAQQGWKVVLVEASPLAALQAGAKPATCVDDFEPRVSAISKASQRLLERVGGFRFICLSGLGQSGECFVSTAGSLTGCIRGTIGISRCLVHGHECFLHAYGQAFGLFDRTGCVHRGFIDGSYSVIHAFRQFLGFFQSSGGIHCRLVDRSHGVIHTCRKFLGFLQGAGGIHGCLVNRSGRIVHAVA